MKNLLLRAGAAVLAFAAAPCAAQSAASIVAPAGYAPISAPCTRQADQSCLVVSTTNPMPVTNAGNPAPAAQFWNGATGTSAALAGAASYTGASRDAGAAAGSYHPFAYFNAFFLADQVGTAIIDCSNDASVWYVCASNAVAAGIPLTLSLPAMTRYHRARLVNGATAETYLWVNTAYTGA